MPIAKCAEDLCCTRFDKQCVCAPVLLPVAASGTEAPRLLVGVKYETMLVVSDCTGMCSFGVCILRRAAPHDQAMDRSRPRSPLVPLKSA